MRRCALQIWASLKYLSTFHHWVISKLKKTWISRSVQVHPVSTMFVLYFIDFIFKLWLLLFANIHTVHSPGGPSYKQQNYVTGQGIVGIQVLNRYRSKHFLVSMACCMSVHDSESRPKQTIEPSYRQDFRKNKIKSFSPFRVWLSAMLCSSVLFLKKPHSHKSLTIIHIFL